jgi:hypothetical protein
MKGVMIRSLERAYTAWNDLCSKQGVFQNDWLNQCIQGACVTLFNEWTNAIQMASSLETVENQWKCVVYTVILQAVLPIFNMHAGEQLMRANNIKISRTNFTKDSLVHETAICEEWLLKVGRDALQVVANTWSHCLELHNAHVQERQQQAEAAERLLAMQRDAGQQNPLLHDMTWAASHREHAGASDATGHYGNDDTQNDNEDADYAYDDSMQQLDDFGGEVTEFACDITGMRGPADADWGQTRDEDDLRDFAHVYSIEHPHSNVFDESGGNEKNIEGQGSVSPKDNSSHDAHSDVFGDSDGNENDTEGQGSVSPKDNSSYDAHSDVLDESDGNEKNIEARGSASPKGNSNGGWRDVSPEDATEANKIAWGRIEAKRVEESNKRIFVSQFMENVQQFVSQHLISSPLQENDSFQVVLNQGLFYFSSFDEVQQTVQSCLESIQQEKPSFQFNFKKIFKGVTVQEGVRCKSVFAKWEVLQSDECGYDSHDFGILKLFHPYNGEDDNFPGRFARITFERTVHENLYVQAPGLSAMSPAVQFCVSGRGRGIIGASYRSPLFLKDSRNIFSQAVKCRDSAFPQKSVQSSNKRDLKALGPANLLSASTTEASSSRTSCVCLKCGKMCRTPLAKTNGAMSTPIHRAKASLRVRYEDMKGSC